MQDNSVKPVAFGTAKAVVDVGAGNESQARPGNEVDDGGRKVLPEKRHGGLLVLETGLDQLVVRLMQTLFRHVADVSKIR